jgi:hypothetical protein
MACWKSPRPRLAGAGDPRRIAGLPDDAVAAASTPAGREVIIKAAIDRR